EVVSRIKESITSTKVTIGEVEIPIYLNIGSATYWKDGESAQQLVQHAQLRKQQAKAEEPGNVVWFPKEYVN
ncbi:MAG: hypothetical protein ACRD6X_07650, partial [Pyrinomonadaceae bacterium]